MEFGSLYTIALMRWAHIVLGIIWLGYFFYMHMLVRPYLSGLDGDAKAKAYRSLVWRGLKWCRGASIAVLILGIGVLGHLWVEKVYFTEKVGLVSRGKYIMWGMTFACIMLANLWFLIAPAQKKILAAFESGIGAGEADMNKACRLGTVNVYLTGPMLMLMAFANNFPSFHYGHMGLAFVVGMAVIHLLVVIARKGDS